MLIIIKLFKLKNKLVIQYEINFKFLFAYFSYLVIYNYKPKFNQ